MSSSYPSATGSEPFDVAVQVPVQGSAPVATPSPGWYRTAEGSHERFWDGREWSAPRLVAGAAAAAVQREIAQQHDAAGGAGAGNSAGSADQWWDPVPGSTATSECPIEAEVPEPLALRPQIDAALCALDPLTPTMPREDYERQHRRLSLRHRKATDPTATGAVGTRTGRLSGGRVGVGSGSGVTGSGPEPLLHGDESMELPSWATVPPLSTRYRRGSVSDAPSVTERIRDRERVLEQTRPGVSAISGALIGIWGTAIAGAVEFGRVRWNEGFVEAALRGHSNQQVVAVVVYVVWVLLSAADVRKVRSFCPHSMAWALVPPAQALWRLLRTPTIALWASWVGTWLMLFVWTAPMEWLDAVAALLGAEPGGELSPVPAPATPGPSAPAGN